jgi:hypothetical protein
MYTTKTPIDMWRFNVPQLKEFLTFSVKDISIKLFYLYQRLQCADYYFFKLSLFSLFIYCLDICLPTIAIRLFRIMSIPIMFRLFRVLTSEMLGRRLPVLTLLL